MEKYAEYISKVEIASLWQGRKHIVWHLDPQVNVLSGTNGIGKSTILRRMEGGVRYISHASRADITIETVPSDATLLRYDVITTPEVRSEFDANLSALQQRLVHYPRDERWHRFCDIVDEMFSSTEKTIDRSTPALVMRQWGSDLDLRLLSSGEKQLLTILLTVYLQSEQPTVLMMDEPEVSLHIEWQQVLIETILKLNPRAQIILSTHSPAIIMNGWMDKVTEVSDITVE